MPLGVAFQHHRLEAGRPAPAVNNFDFRARPRPFARPHHRPPVVGRVFLQQQRLEFSARARIAPAQARRDDPRVVQDQHVAGAKIFQQIGELPVRARGVQTFQHQQTRLIAGGGGLLRNQPLG